MKVLFVCSGNSKNFEVVPFIKAQADSLKFKGVDIEISSIKGKGALSYLLHAFILRDLLRDSHYDLIHAHYSLCGFVASIATFGKKIPVIVSLMGSDVKDSGIWFRLIRLFARVVWHATIVKSDDMHESLGLYGPETIPNGVNLKLFSHAQRAECRILVNWEEKKRVILFGADPARVVKNYPLAQQAYEILIANNSKLTTENCQLVALGSIPHEQIPTYLNACNILLLTSKWEGSPNIIKEAMACGTPIVCTDVGDVRWLLDGVDGCFVTNHDPGDIARRLDIALRFEGITNGRERLIKLGLDSESIAKRILDLYELVLKKRHGGRGMKKFHKPGVIIIEGHVQGLANTRLLGVAGIPVIVVDKEDCVARYSKYCKAYYKCPDYLGDDFADFLVRLHRAFGLHDWLLLPSNDHAVHTIARNKARLSKCFKIITEDLDVIEKIYNKRNLLEIAQKADIPIPATVMPDSENPQTVDLRYPILVKGNQGLSFYKRFKHKALIIKCPSELERVWDSQLLGAEPDEYFIQEVIPYDHKTVSVTVFADRGVIHSYWMGIKLREHPITFGTATCCKSVFEADMLELSRKLITELGFSGVCEIEWLRDSRDNKPKLIEINARTWLWVGLAAKCGVDYPNMIYNYIHDHSLPQPVDYPRDVFWLNIYTDVVYSLRRIIHRIDSFAAILGTYKRFNEATWDISDPLPFVKYAMLMGRFLKQR